MRVTSIQSEKKSNRICDLCFADYIKQYAGIIAYNLLNSCTSEDDINNKLYEIQYETERENASLRLALENLKQFEKENYYWEDNEDIHKYSSLIAEYSPPYSAVYENLRHKVSTLYEKEKEFADYYNKMIVYTKDVNEEALIKEIDHYKSDNFRLRNDIDELAKKENRVDKKTYLKSAEEQRPCCVII